MRVPSDELLSDRPQAIRDREPPGIRLYLRKEDPLEDQIADLAAERVVICAIDRVEHFVRLLEHESSQRFNRLLVVPRTAARSAQPRHDVYERLKLASRAARRRPRS